MHAYIHTYMHACSTVLVKSKENCRDWKSFSDHVPIDDFGFLITTHGILSTDISSLVLKTLIPVQYIFCIQAIGFLGYNPLVYLAPVNCRLLSWTCSFFLTITFFTDHPGFQSVCLDVNVLRTAYNHWLQDFQDDAEEVFTQHEWVL